MNNITMNADTLFREIRTDFSSIWSSKLRGETLEIITPFSTLLGNAISVFLTQREDRYIISDGKRVCELLSENNLAAGKKYASFLDEIAKHYSIKNTANDASQMCFYFKSTNDLRLISAYIYDLVFFEKAAIDSIYASQVYFQNEDAQWQHFSTRVNILLNDRIKELRMKNRFFKLERQNQIYRDLRFSAVLGEEGSSHRWFAMYISGSTPGNFCDHYGRASVGFGFINQNPELKRLAHLSLVIDENARGFSARKQMVEAARKQVRDAYSPREYTYAQLESITDLDSLFLDQNAG